MSERGHMFGAGRYIQGAGAIAGCAQEIARLGKKALVIAGKTAWAQVGDALTREFSAAGIEPVFYWNDGYCSRNQMGQCAADVRENACDVIVAVGGGKCMDLGKAVAADCRLPVATIPTVAATCAAVTPFSVMYDDMGRPDGAIYHDRPVDLCFADLDVLAQAPLRTLKAGLIDAMAKLPELCSYSDTPEEWTVMQEAAVLLAEYIWKTADVYCGCIARAERYEIDRCVELSIAVTGVCSGGASGTRQLAVAHAFNSAVRHLNHGVANGYLHGETVGVGILVQMAFNRQSEAQIEAFRQTLRALEMPDSVSVFDVSLEQTARFIAEHMRFDASSAQAESILRAVKRFA